MSSLLEIGQEITDPTQLGGAYDPRAWNAKCDLCPLNDLVPARPSGPFDAPIMVVGEGPGFHEVQQGRVFVGPSGIKLDDLLTRAGHMRQNTYVTNAVLCRPEVPGESAKRRYSMNVYVAWFRKQNAERRKHGLPELNSPFQCCRPRLLLELQILEANARANGNPNGLVVVPVGNHALRAVTGLQGVLKYRGSVIEQPVPTV